MNLLIQSLHPYFKKYRWYLIIGVIFIVISNFFSIYPAQLVRNGFDLIVQKITLWQVAKTAQEKSRIENELFYEILYYSVGILAAALLRGIFLFGVRQAIIVMSRHIEYEQKNEIFQKYLRYSQNNLRKFRTGDLMARIAEDVGHVRMFTGPGIMYSINTVSLFIMVLMTMIYVNYELTFYVLWPLPVLSITIYLVHTKIIQKSEAVQKQLSVVSSFTQETYSGIRTIRAYDKEKLFTHQFVASTDLYKQKSLDLAKFNVLFYPVIMFLIGLSTIIAVWFGGIKTFQGEISVGNIAEFVMYVSLLTWPIASLGWVTSLTQRAAASQARINEVLNVQSEIYFPKNQIKIQSGSISFRNVSFSYPDTGIQALQNINFHINPRTSVGIVGATGSGKSTLFNLITRTFEPNQGEILIDNSIISQYSKQSLNEAITIVPQDVFLFSDTIRANIAFGKPDASELEIQNAAKFASVYDDIMNFPKKMNTIIGEKGVTLSGGQKQRISIARAYLKKAKIILLDDCLSAVDNTTEEKIIEQLQNGFENKPTLLISSHRLSIMPRMDFILVLQKGKIEESGSHSELMNLKGIYYKMFMHQQRENQ